MNEPDAASEQVAETEPGVDQTQFNPHQGHLDPDQQPDGSQGKEPEAKTTEDDAEAPPASEETAETKPDDDALQRKVGELAFENRQLKRQLDAAGQEQASDDVPPEPLKTLKDFNYDEQAFNEYLIEEGAKRGEARARKAMAADTAKTEADRRQDEFEAREDAFEAENPGFKERLHDENLRISPEMAMFIADPSNEVGLHVGDFLSRNPTEAAKIAGLPPTQQMREMVKLESRIGKEVAKAAAEKTKTSEAPEPPANTVDGTDPGISLDPSNPDDADKMSDEEWIRRRNKQLNAKR